MEELPATAGLEYSETTRDHDVEVARDAACGEWDLTDVTGTDAEHVWAFGDRQIRSNFDVAGTLTEAILLGNVAIRAQKKLEYDPKTGRVTNDEKASSSDSSGGNTHRSSRRISSAEVRADARHPCLATVHRHVQPVALRRREQRALVVDEREVRLVPTLVAVVCYRLIP